MTPTVLLISPPPFQPRLAGCPVTFSVIRSLSTKPPKSSVPAALTGNLEPTQLAVSTKGGKIIVTTTGDSLVIEKEKPSQEPIQIVRIEAEDPPRDVR